MYKNLGAVQPWSCAKTLWKYFCLKKNMCTIPILLLLLRYLLMSFPFDIMLSHTAKFQAFDEGAQT